MFLVCLPQAEKGDNGYRQVGVDRVLTPHKESPPERCSHLLRGPGNHRHGWIFTDNRANRIGKFLVMGL